MSARGAGLALLLLAAGAGPALAAKPPEVESRAARGLYELEGSFEVAASSRIAWEVLSDYDHIASFVSSMRHSAARQRRGSSILVEQEGKARAFIFTRRVRLLLHVDESPWREIAFRDVSNKDFDGYEGSWTITETAGGSQVLYRLKARPRGGGPEWIGRRAFRRGVSGLLGEVQAEMLRRAKP